uniref:Cullin family profile domain-containing protein n=1 Tax=Mycena chlorophos TaxID=658473 RepID=A0ABQ0L846_MYCCL|nr:predicted protein [Mycena chlorophos]
MFLLAFKKADAFSSLPSSDTNPDGPRDHAPIRILTHGPQPPVPKRAPDDLRRYIKRILDGQSATLSVTYDHIYGACFSAVCVADAGEDLYDKVKAELQMATDRLSREITGLGQPQDAEAAARWIEAFVAKCTWFEKQVSLLQSVLTHLDQVYVQRAQTFTIRELAFSAFASSIFGRRSHAETLQAAVSHLVNGERRAGVVADSKTCIPALIQHLYAHQQFSAFELRYRDMTRDFYETNSTESHDKFKDAPQTFFAHVQTQLNFEMERSKQLLPVGSWAVVREAALKALLTQRMKWIAENTVGSYLDAKDFASLKAMNMLFSQADNAKVVCDAFGVHVLKSVQAIVKNPAEDDKMVESLLALHALAESAIQTCFLEVASYQTSSDLPSTSTLLRKGQGAKTNAQYEQQIDQVLGLSRFTEDKDVFRGFYLRALAKRLLLEKSASNDFEITILNKLKKDYDPEFSAGGEMFTDLALSNDLITEHHRKLPLKGEGRKLKVMVLKQGAWPYSQQPQGIRLPTVMQEQLGKFEAFYKAKHQGRTLHWQSSVSTMTLTAHFTEQKELSVSLYQGVILLLFNESSAISFKEIAQATELEDGLLRLTLQSLACGKKRVLRKQPAGRDVNDNDVFHFNETFTDSLTRIHINSIQAKVSAEESKATQSAIDGERSASLDAAIVRIMKAKKEVMHGALVNAVIDAVKNHFTPDVPAIKVRIEKLIDQEYMRRDESNQQKFIYVA